MDKVSLLCQHFNRLQLQLMVWCCNTVKEDVMGRKYCIVPYSEMDNGFAAFLGKHLILFLRNKSPLEQRLRRFTNDYTQPLKLFCVC